jgi:hypothetical protein
LDLIYMKHPELGNRHVPADQVAQLLASGWTRFPRSRAEKQRGAWPPAAPAVALPARAPAPRPVAAAPAADRLDDYGDYDDDAPPDDVPPAPAPAPAIAPPPQAAAKTAKAGQKPAKA